MPRLLKRRQCMARPRGGAAAWAGLVVALILVAAAQRGSPRFETQVECQP